ncbi:hypothetical protein DNTS_020999 [Danionella cerebrum]|uniref:EGF-like domain-containing protein n=1 Tax=Danionella cerebrum TaxID=2873325 RepID=A0A553Q3Z2_9TELE|nr:hypothetical protein DNTS_020999 [Danionella translucida]
MGKGRVKRRSSPGAHDLPRFTSLKLYPCLPSPRGFDGVSLGDIQERRRIRGGQASVLRLSSRVQRTTSKGKPRREHHRSARWHREHRHPEKGVMFAAGGQHRSVMSEEEVEEEGVHYAEKTRFYWFFRAREEMLLGRSSHPSEHLTGRRGARSRAGIAMTMPHFPALRAPHCVIVPVQEYLDRISKDGSCSENYQGSRCEHLQLPTIHESPEENGMIAAVVIIVLLIVVVLSVVVYYIYKIKRTSQSPQRAKEYWKVKSSSISAQPV